MTDRGILSESIPWQKQPFISTDSTTGEQARLTAVVNVTIPARVCTMTSEKEKKKIINCKNAHSPYKIVTINTAVSKLSVSSTMVSSTPLGPSWVLWKLAFVKGGFWDQLPWNQLPYLLSFKGKIGTPVVYINFTRGQWICRAVSGCNR